MRAFPHRHLAAGICLAAAVHCCAAAQTAAALLEQARNAVGGDAWLRVSTQHMDFVRSYPDHDEAGSSDIDYASGRYAQRIPSSAIARLTSRSDGSSFWRQRLGRMEKLEGAAADPAQHLGRQTYAWWFARGKEQQVQLLAPRLHDGIAYDVVHIVLADGSAFDYWIHPATHRVERRQELVDGKTRTVDYRDFRRVGNVTLPYEERERDADDSKDLEVLRIASIVLNRPAAQMDFSLPPPAAMQGFSAARPAVTVPFEHCHGHICIMLNLNGRGPFRFVLDTGARNVMSDKLYKLLQLPAEGRGILSGVGEQAERGALTTVRQIALGGLTLAHQPFFTSPTLDELPIDGAIGYEWLWSTPTLIDYAQQQLTFYDPATFVYQGEGSAIPFSFRDKTPQIAGVLDGLPGQFTIDTGSDDTLTLGKSFVDRFGLIDKYQAGGELRVSRGIGGHARTLATRGTLFEIGGVRIANPALELSRQPQGALGADLAGNISNGILQQFSVLFDYQRGKVYMTPNKIVD
ncbi:MULTISPECIES: pepsin/retropepsin-like aspartic protease family protein [unclassified Duganella]|uniref:pepsin/retropepsin-like aspartic protease family protein n=1 Tax=unclassified Duganella TaxID=2636909 RepID=UPI000E3512CC|nr:MULTISPECIES: pepsin/retropepsin-like aspartic protease family protein [unclassified Duganella]RFP16067.1 hypothetical protein D0T23_09235 [Duganella sp. BJB475]RFP32769.1 hypothetical protein D0T21_11400 [Duganella sp. BJB476]